MANFTLKARSALDGLKVEHAGIFIEEITDRALVSIAPPLDGAATLDEALQQAYGAGLPPAGKCVQATTDNAMIIAMARDQFFIIFDELGRDPATTVDANLNHAGYVVDQSDSWAMLRIAGNDCRSALERMCPIDLHPAVFGKGDATRTVMEHLAVMIIYESATSFILLSARSSAKSFAHALETSARNVA